ERGFFQSDGESKPRRLPIRLGRFRLSFRIRYISSGVLRYDRDRCTAGKFVGFSAGAYGFALEKISRTVAARADFSFAGGASVWLCRRRRPGGIFLSLDQVASRYHPLAPLFALRLDCDRRAHSCAAFISVCFLGAAESGSVGRGSSARGRRWPLAYRGDRQLAAGAAVDPVQQRSDFLVGVRIVWFAAGVGRPCGPARAHDLSV